MFALILLLTSQLLQFFFQCYEHYVACILSVKGEIFMYMNNDSDLSAYATNDMLTALLQMESRES